MPIDDLTRRHIGNRSRDAREALAKDAMDLQRAVQQFCADIIVGGQFGGRARNIASDAAELAMRAATVDAITDLADILAEEPETEVKPEPEPAAADHHAMTDEELLRSDLGTRVREILFRRLEEQAQEFYANARLKGSGSTMVAGITLARDWVYPEDVWAYGFRDSEEWDEPFTPTEEDRAELMRRIAALDYKVDRDQVERMAMAIADEKAASRGETPKAEEQPEPAPEPLEWAVVQRAHRTSRPLRRATVHKIPCRGAGAKIATVPALTLSDVWGKIARGYYADGPQPPTDLTTLFTLCSTCGADKALQEAKGDDLDAWKAGERLWRP